MPRCNTLLLEHTRVMVGVESGAQKTRPSAVGGGSRVAVGGGSRVGICTV
jgi:hypothetical protein